MWSDTLLALERAHLIRVTAWAAGSVMAGSLLFVWLTVRRLTLPLLHHFALQTALWGVIILLIAVAAWRSLAMRDYAGAMRLQHVLWMTIGLLGGVIGVGATLAITSFRRGRWMGGVGAGLGIIVQGVALLLLDGRLLALIGGQR